MAQRGDLIIFVEVKRRLNDKFGDVRTSIDSRKRHNLVRAAQGWLYEHGTTNSERSYRFDVILLHPPDNKGKVRLEHIEDAFRP